MNFQSALLLALAFTLLGFATIRSEIRARWVVFTFLDLPVMILIVRWAAFRKTWAETALGLGLACFLLLGWWLLLGRRLPPKDNPVRIWSKEDPF